MSRPIPTAGAPATWQRAAARPRLGNGEVQVWRADLDRPAWPLPRLAATLAPDERRRAGRFIRARDQRRFVAARGLLRMLLAGYLGTAAETLALRDGRNRKPELGGPPAGPPMRFNYSRSQGRAVYGFTRGRRIGVDLEALRPVPEAEGIAQRWFTRREHSELLAVPAARRDEAFLRGWTRKEAYVKAVGDGLAHDVARIDVSLEEANLPALRAVDGDPDAAAGWSLPALPPIDGYLTALVVEGHDHRVVCWSLDPGDR